MIKKSHLQIAILCTAALSLFGCNDRPVGSEKGMDGSQEKIQYSQETSPANTVPSPLPESPVYSTTPAPLPTQVSLSDSSSASVHTAAIDDPTEIVENSFFISGSELEPTSSESGPDIEIEFSTPTPISAISENIKESSNLFPPDPLIQEPTPAKVDQFAREVHYDEIDQSRLRRNDIAYLIGEDQPFTGLAFKRYSDGTRSFEIDYVNGSAEGVLTQYYPNGNPSFQVQMKNNQANGISTGWYEDQTRKSEYPYKDGVVHGVIKEWFPTGQLGFEAIYEEGKITGTLKGWYLTGEEYTIGTVEPDQAQRFTAYYDPNRMWKETGWRNGKLWGYSYEWEPDGKIRTLKKFEDGKLIKVIK
jgi:antitoxin component YwqK of YwqJK toxin-antitoxin module